MEELYERDKSKSRFAYQAFRVLSRREIHNRCLGSTLSSGCEEQPLGRGVTFSLCFSASSSCQVFSLNQVLNTSKSPLSNSIKHLAFFHLLFRSLVLFIAIFNLQGLLPHFTRITLPFGDAYAANLNLPCKLNVSYDQTSSLRCQPYLLGSQTSLNCLTFFSKSNKHLLSLEGRLVTLTEHLPHHHTLRHRYFSLHYYPNRLSLRTNVNFFIASRKCVTYFTRWLDRHPNVMLH